MELDPNDLLLALLPPVIRDLRFVLDPLVDEQGRANNPYTGEVIWWNIFEKQP